MGAVPGSATATIAAQTCSRSNVERAVAPAGARRAMLNRVMPTADSMAHQGQAGKPRA
jgi:hypothetical protein